MQKLLDARFEKAGDDASGYTYSVTLSSNRMDRDMDTINPNGWSIPDFVPLLAFHDAKSLPIGRVRSVAPSGSYLRGVIEFPPEGTYTYADTCRRLLDGGYLRALSVGFIATEEPTKNAAGGLDFDGQVLTELSLVNVPSNIDAAVNVRGMKAWLGDSLVKAGRVLSGTNEGHVRVIAEAADTIADHCYTLLSQIEPDNGGDDAVMLDDEPSNTVDGETGKSFFMLDDEQVDRLATIVARAAGVWRPKDITVQRHDDVGLDAIPYVDPSTRYRGRTGEAWDEYRGRRREIPGISERDVLEALREVIAEEVPKTMVEAQTAAIRRARGLVD